MSAPPTAQQVGLPEQHHPLCCLSSNERLFLRRQDIGTEVGEAWRGLSDGERAPYTKRAEADRKRYEGQLRAIARKAKAAAAR